MTERYRDLGRWVQCSYCVDLGAILGAPYPMPLVINQRKAKGNLIFCAVLCFEPNVIRKTEKVIGIGGKEVAVLYMGDPLSGEGRRVLDAICENCPDFEKAEGIDELMKMLDELGERKLDFDGGEFGNTEPGG